MIRRKTPNKKKTYKSTETYEKIYEPCSVKRGLDVFAKSIDSRQPAQSAQADVCRNFSVSLFFSAIHFIIPHLIQSLSKWILWIHNYGASSAAQCIQGMHQALFCLSGLRKQTESDDQRSDCTYQTCFLKSFLCTASIDRGHMVFGLSVCPSVRPFVRLFFRKNFYIGQIIRLLRDRAFNIVARPICW